MKQKKESRRAIRQETLTEMYSGLTASKLVLLFTIGCVVGFVLETIFTLFNKGYLESRRGMIYGPFNQVYGFGLVLIVLALTPLAKQHDRALFLGSAVVGGTFEFLCSLLQERVIGTVSWEYSADPLSIGGRTSLLFMFYWGVLGVVLMRYIYPYALAQIDRIPQRTQVGLSRALAVFLAANMLVSLAAVTRWHDRVGGQPPESAVDVILDDLYPNERLEKIYPTMTIVDADGHRPMRDQL